MRPTDDADEPIQEDWEADTGVTDLGDPNVEGGTFDEDRHPTA